MKAAKKVVPPKKRADKAGTPVFARLQDEELFELDEWRRNQPDLPSRPEALKRMMKIVLAQKPGKK